jgi:hypothetical protein
MSTGPKLFYLCESQYYFQIFMSFAIFDVNREIWRTWTKMESFGVSAVWLYICHFEFKMTIAGNFANDEISVAV